LVGGSRAFAALFVSYSLIVRSRAEQDLAEASLWYEGRAPGTGAYFVRCVDAAISLIIRQPQAGPVYFQQFRRVLVPRFPFGIFYSIESEAIIVHAVLHLSRDPDKIRRLLQTAYEGPTG